MILISVHVQVFQAIQASSSEGSSEESKGCGYGGCGYQSYVPKPEPEPCGYDGCGYESYVPKPEPLPEPEPVPEPCGYDGCGYEPSPKKNCEGDKCGQGVSMSNVAVSMNENTNVNNVKSY